MKMDGRRLSSNVVDGRGKGGAVKAGGIGIGGILIAGLICSLFYLYLSIKINSRERQTCLQIHKVGLSFPY